MTQTGYGPAQRCIFDGDEDKYEQWECKMLAYMKLRKLKHVILPGAPATYSESQWFNHNDWTTVTSRNGRNKSYCVKLFTSECVNIFFSFTSTQLMVSMVTVRLQTIWKFCNLFVYTSPIIERLHNSVNFHRVKTVNNNTKHERMQKLGILVTTW